LLIGDKAGEPNQEQPQGALRSPSWSRDTVAVEVGVGIARFAGAWVIR
jgi:hypothetical protein